MKVEQNARDFSIADEANANTKMNVGRTMLIDLAHREASSSR